MSETSPKSRQKEDIAEKKTRGRQENRRGVEGEKERGRKKAYENAGEEEMCSEKKSE